MLTVKNWVYLTALGHFEIVATENGEKPKSDIYITQPLFVTVLPINPKTYVSEGGKYHELVQNNLLYNNSF